MSNLNPVVVYSGPTLQKLDILKYLPNAIVLPPIQCGDILKAMRINPHIIVIIDGYFEHRASVWHKEIIFALEKGIYVFGGASMGAIRAAELDTFGMIGVGDIYQDFKKGILTDDDEVAVLHSPSSQGYTTTTDAMVDVRATLDSAICNKILSKKISSQIEIMVKSQFYQNRSLKSAIREIKKYSNHDSLEHFEKFININGLVQKKYMDAIATVKLVKKYIMKNKFESAFKVQPSLFFAKLYREISCSSIHPSLAKLSINETKLIDRLTEIGMHYSVNLSALASALATTEFTKPVTYEVENINRLVYLIFIIEDCGNKYPKKSINEAIEKYRGQSPVQYKKNLFLAKINNEIIKNLSYLRIFPGKKTIELYQKALFKHFNIFNLTMFDQWLEKNNLDRSIFIELACLIFYKNIAIDSYNPSIFNKQPILSDVCWLERCCNLIDN